ncbi:hypothetical protein L1285_16755 [Pseudoalteromonas sp. DL2-H2.2]|uniref:hypothetical protein n=1 Tax=Pseudoalteromonas sp. DL2-H2.2 TaxID=2908889 RepID=UPI001F3A983D|nr:hypothetical protein [Pseudoalteromonas sp. DL2-H2.2]MCF2909972.1 hypothetical protein [Pseudoalteromonas sp. DL2-H2.2]
MEISPFRFIAICTILVAAFSFALLDSAAFNLTLLAVVASTAWFCQHREQFACRDNAIILGTLLVVEYVSFNYLIELNGDMSPLYLGLLVFGLQVLYSGIAFNLFIYRPLVSLKLTGRFQMHYSDNFLMYLVGYETFICFIALVESTVRNLIPEFNGWTFIYDNFELFTYLGRAGMFGVLLIILFDVNTPEREGI